MGRTFDELMELAGRKWNRKDPRDRRGKKDDEVDGKGFFEDLNALRDEDPQAARLVKRAMAKFHKKETDEEQQERFAHQDKILHVRAKAMDPEKREKFLAAHAKRREGMVG